MSSQWEDKSKPHLNIVFVGHVDHGKSTTVGRLLLDTGHIEAHVVEKFEQEAQERGKPGFGFAYVMDGLKEERERGITIDVAHKEFFTPRYYFTVIDAPGHRDFVKNMITGTSQAEAAVLCVAADDGVNLQTKEHTFLARVLGVKQLIVNINKMDMNTVNHSEDRFNAVVEEVSELLKVAGFNPADVPFIPCSAIKGDNVYNKSDNMPWYKGPTLFEAIDAIEMPPKPTNRPLRLPIQDVYKISGIGTVPVGKIETGVLTAGKTVVFNPSQKSAEVKSIEMHHTNVDRAEPGDNVGFNVRGLAATDIRRGDVAGYTDNPPMFVRHDETFVGQIQLMEIPKAVGAGYTPVFHAHTSQVAVRFVDLLENSKTKEANPPFLKTGDAALVRFQPTKPMAIEQMDMFPELARFAIRDMGKTVAAGVCMKVEKK
ncbi:MAG: translation elongation factor EF-1 subunit alpha [Candidatus Thalassarchaeum betae]|uniref:Elongation factor 1-alpha n=1 Tax=Candidatus Thalassarchaeum betae TaxID=2599289 RepID=A0A2V3HQT6_9ARCH|nr:MAG: translation elongation factor EF-1 subunit alpha [Candidatus Thalassoarchaea betae]PXF26437.1 MAG: translation elongation factor EF-1 subunit alpha [Euryarchaeota archaeon]HIC50837.1 translation elongation factor EF-1 subunit alpha [Candidatus Poseidoniales archaeon]HIM13474.1 translation elongation factor EF-1 subunit alpha [Candidatus Poseidoniales archaeon]HIM92366.1 translation elongation factor EF-1 subunit alpha [Candidatus Poseidoniales archaeon]